MLGGSSNVTWTNLSGKPSAFPPEAHTQGIASVTGLQAALDAKQAAGSYAAASHPHAISEVAGLQAALDGKQASGSYEPAFAAGTTAQYYRGDKTWQTLPTGGGSPPTLYQLTSAHSNNTVTPSTIGGAAPWTHTLVAGKAYRFTVFATHQAAATTTGGRMNLLGAGGLAGTVAGMMWGGIAQAAAATTLEVPIYSFANGAGSFLLTTGVNPINAPHIWGADFVFRCTTGGTLSLQWASEVAASAAQLNAGAVLMVELLN